MYETQPRIPVLLTNWTTAGITPPPPVPESPMPVPPDYPGTQDPPPPVEDPVPWQDPPDTQTTLF